MSDGPRYDDSLTIALLRARDVVTAQFREHVAEAGLTLTQWRVIRALAEGEALDTTSLSNRCVILLPSLTRIIRFHVNAGYVEHVPTRDRRQRVFRLTDSGKDLFERVWATSAQKYANIEFAFGKQETRELVTTLNRLRASLE